MTKICIKRGPSSLLPGEGSVGELMATTDTKKLYLGDGVGNALLELGSQGPQGYQGGVGVQGSQGFQGSIGSQGYQGYQGTSGNNGGFSRYATSSSPNCQVLASGPGVDVVITGPNPCSATISVPNGVILLSASIYVTSAQMGTTATGYNIYLPAGFGNGIGSSFYAIQYTNYRETSGSRAAIGAANFNTAQNCISFTGLTANMNWICNVSF
jgi:hypothetical protein